MDLSSCLGEVEDTTKWEQSCTASFVMLINRTGNGGESILKMTHKCAHQVQKVG